MDLIDYITTLSNKSTRQQSAQKLAHFIGAKNLIVFIRDQQMDVLLPGPGFCQMLPKSKDWKEFINRNEATLYEGLFPDPDSGHLLPSVGIPSLNGSIAVLIHCSISEKKIPDLQRILPLLISLLTEEQKIEAFAGTAEVAKKSSEKSDRLAKALDMARIDLLKTLEENSILLKRLQERNEELEKINNELDSFVYTASHDLKAPISNLEGLIHVLDELVNEEESGEVYTVVKLMTVAINRFKATIQDLTDVTKIQRDAEDDKADRVNLQEIIEELKVLFARNIESSRAKIIVNLEVTEINFSRKNLWSILNNLFSNALKYNAPYRTPEINISSERKNEYLVLKVPDNGLGIKEESIGKLFTMFRRFHNHVEGSGIGLYLVKRIVENYGGKVEVHSQEGVGSTFTIYLKNEIIKAE